MSLPPLSPSELLLSLVCAGIVLVFCVFLPVQLVSKCRRMRRRRRLIICRICGYRFVRRDTQATCPHCGARNR